ncbi:hypothetical protein KUV86_12215 [Halomonas sp. DP8Y7-3]|uniref:hypothetical protein n=1 Tax=Halomonas sp. DP8Y7-3 TaxID=2859079 RepID=UPI001C965969|nr:hypothetical protein [Halomonas sp. DP8Y7-3]MBY5929874.1 hypothetical protein [Halomonas sp. DP8Y7-3]
MKIFRAEPSRWHHFGKNEIGLVDRLFIKTEREKPDFYRRMFDKDFATVFFSPNRQSGDLFEIVSNAEEIMTKLIGNTKVRCAPRSIDGTIRKLVEEIGQSLIWFGRAYYFLYDDKNNGQVHIASFSSGGVVRLLGTHIQWVPSRRESYWDRDNKIHPREIRILDAAKTMRFDMPILFKRMLSTQNRTITIIDKHQYEAIKFQPLATHENPNPTNHFDFRIWREIQERALYRATRKTGWNGRVHDSSNLSDFFVCHRLIRFRRNQLLLRDEILKQLSSELSRIGKSYNAEFSVNISPTDKLPTVAHLNELEVKLTREEVGFNEIIEYCYTC